MNIQVLTRDQAEKHEFSVPHAFISIADSDQPFAQIRENSQTRASLRLQFDDIGAEGEYGRPVVLFSKEHAQRIMDFWLAHRDDVDLFVIHCNAGQCRSPAVAAALDKIALGDDNRWFRTKNPNMRVYNMIVDEALDREERGELVTNLFYKP